MKRHLATTVFLIATSWLPGAAAAICADLSLVLAVDSSSSIDAREFELQVQGYAKAFLDPDVQRALRAAGRVDLAVVFWADSEGSSQIIPWRRIESPQDAEAVADGFLAFRRNISGQTDIGEALMTALALFDLPDQCSSRSLINLSGDGRETTGPHRKARASLHQARALAEHLGVTVNGLAIESDEPTLGDYYDAEVITGPGAFVMRVDVFAAFADAIELKLEREITPDLSAGLDPALLR